MRARPVKFALAHKDKCKQNLRNGIAIAHTYQSALGWFDLGNYTEAWNELENLPPKDPASIEVMESRCRIYRKLEKWSELGRL